MRTRIPITLALVTLLLACEDQQGTLAPEGIASGAIPTTVNASVASQIAQLRRLVAPFHDFDAAVHAGWAAQITSCLEAPGLGAMGFHYGNLEYIQDQGVVDLLQPELLLYEPQKNGKLRFVGVEYIVPFADHPDTAAAPTLLGQKFAQVPEFQVWGLHIYVGRENPSGIFAPWNPKVSCENAGNQRVVGGHTHGQ
jgi:hypothetical protein